MVVEESIGVPTSTIHGVRDVYMATWGSVVCVQQAYIAYGVSTWAWRGVKKCYIKYPWRTRCVYGSRG